MFFVAIFVRKCGFSEKMPEKHSSSTVFNAFFHFPINWTSVRQLIKKVCFLSFETCKFGHFGYMDLKIERPTRLILYCNMDNDNLHFDHTLLYKSGPNKNKNLTKPNQPCVKFVWYSQAVCVIIYYLSIVCTVSCQ